METLIYEKLEKNRVKCGICHHFCVIKEGAKGICGVRENRDGRLYSLVYPEVIAASIDPIEKKPVFHLKPGSTSYSIATVGCNFGCTFCQNADIAQMPQGPSGMIRGRHLSPETIVKEALAAGCGSISYTYTEPTVFFELALATAKIASKEGLFNIFVTNGYMSGEVLDRIAPYLTAANVDLKAFNEDFYRTYCKAGLSPVKENLKKMKALGILVEITTLLIPGLNDDPKELAAMAGFIANDLGKETPWHISRFHPCHRMTDRPSTPVSSLEKAHEAGKTAGLRYVYIGNLPGQATENTYCHACNELLVRRVGYRIETFYKEEGNCPECGKTAWGIY